MKKIILSLLFVSLSACSTTVAVTPSASPSATPIPSQSVSPAPTTSTTPSPSVTPTAIPTPEPIKIDQNKDYNVSMETTMGTIKLKLYPKVAPKTVENFVNLVNRKYYDGVTFHRVINDFMIQGGDPTGTGNGGDSYFGGTFDDEFSPDVSFTSKVGLLAMANYGKNTNKSQFFITLSIYSTSQLTGKHTIFGEVSEGMEVVKAIGLTKTDENDKPVEPVIMKKVTLL